MSLFGMFEGRAGSLENPAVALTGGNVISSLFGGSVNDSGVPVTERTALSMSTVYRCTALISSVAAALPLPVYRKGTRETVGSPLLDEPHPDLTAYDLWKITYVHRCLWGNAYVQKLRGRAGQVQALWPVSPDRVRPFRVHATEANPTGKAFDVLDDWGERHILLPYDLMHIPGLGYDGLQGRSPVRLGAQAIGLALAAEKYGAKLFGSGNLLSGYLTTESNIEDDDAIRLQGQWRQKMAGLDRAHDVPVLDAGAKFVSMTMPNDDAQLLESRHFGVGDVSRWYGVPMFLLNETEKSTSWGTGLEQQAQGWVTFSLHPEWLAPHEQRVTRELLPKSRSAKYKLQGLLRGDSKARAEFYRSQRELGGLSANEMRELEDLPPVPGDGGDSYLQPMNLVPLGTVPDPGAADTGASDDGPETEGDQ